MPGGGQVRDLDEEGDEEAGHAQEQAHQLLFAELGAFARERRRALFRAALCLHHVPNSTRYNQGLLGLEGVLYGVRTQVDL